MDSAPRPGHPGGVKAGPALLVAALACGCGARSSLPSPTPGPGSSPEICTNGDDSPVFVVSYATDGSAVIHRFDPPSATFTTVQKLSCMIDPSTPEGETPFSMAVDHAGQAYVLFRDGRVFRADTDGTDCSPTSYTYDPSLFSQVFGMGFAASAAWGGERLFVSSFFDGTPSRLGYIDTDAMTFHPVGTFSKDVGYAELTGTGDGQLFGFGITENDSTAHVVTIDPDTAAIVSDTAVSADENPGGWAFAFWGGDYYLFYSGATLFSEGSTVDRIRADGTVDQGYAKLPGRTIMGAGVSVCAPR